MHPFRRLAPFVLGAALVACEDNSTGPGAAYLGVVASTFDALGRSRLSIGDGDGAVASRAAALALRTGVRPARVRIAVDGVPEDYWALQVEHVLVDGIDMNSVVGPPSMRTMVAWHRGPAERVISITLSGDTGTFSWARYVPPPDRMFYEPAFGIMFERGGPAHFSVDGGARSVIQALGDECELPDRPMVWQMLIPMTTPRECRAAVYSTRFNMRVQEGPPSGAAAVRAQTVQMEGHTIPGIRIVYPLVSPPCPVCR